MRIMTRVEASAERARRTRYIAALYRKKGDTKMADHWTERAIAHEKPVQTEAPSDTVTPDPPTPDTPFCGCLSVHCTHGYLAVRAGEYEAMFVGPVCDACASTHMRPYLEG